MVDEEDFNAAHLGMTALGAGPSAPMFQRNKSWELVVLAVPAGASPSMEELDTLSPPLAKVFYKALPIPEGSYYYPLQESRLLPDFYDLGQRVLETGLVWDSSMILQWRGLLERYGPLETRPDYGHEDKAQAQASLIWTRNMALIIDCLKSLDNDHSDFRRVVARRLADYEDLVLRLFESRLDDRQRLSESVKRQIATREHSIKTWREYSSGEMVDPTIFESMMRNRVRGGVNEHLEFFGVHPEIRFDDERNDWIHGYEAPSLGGVLWSQIGSMAVDGSRLKRCDNERCKNQPIFEVSATSNRRYCSDTCRFAKVKRNQRLAKAKGKGTNRPGGTR